MTGKDIDDLFDLLKLYFPNSSKPLDKILKKAWLVLLEPFERMDVKETLNKSPKQGKKWYTGKKGEKRHGTDEFKRLRIQQSEKEDKAG